MYSLAGFVSGRSKNSSSVKALAGVCTIWLHDQVSYAASSYYSTSSRLFPLPCYLFVFIQFRLKYIAIALPHVCGGAITSGMGRSFQYALCGWTLCRLRRKLDYQNDAGLMR